MSDVRVDITKLIVAVTVIVCVTVLMALDAVADAVGIPVITTIIGYVLGNGRSVASGNSPATLLDVKPVGIITQAQLDDSTAANG